MKKYQIKLNAFLLMLLFAAVSCTSSSDPAPSLADKLAGNYEVTKIIAGGQDITLLLVKKNVSFVKISETQATYSYEVSTLTGQNLVGGGTAKLTDQGNGALAIADLANPSFAANLTTTGKLTFEYTDPGFGKILVEAVKK